MTFTAKDIAHLVQGTIEGDESVSISKIAKIEEGQPNSICFLHNPKYQKYLYTTNAGIVLVNKDMVIDGSGHSDDEVKPVIIRVENAYLALAQLLSYYEKMLTPPKTGVEKGCFIDDSAEVSEEETYIGAFSYIGKHVKIAKGVKVYPNTYIGDHVSIGEGSVLHPGVKIYHHCEVGRYCILHAGAVIGSDGFGYAQEQDGTFKNIPQVGKVILHDCVDIGANSTVDRGSVGDTVISEGVKLDNLVQIAHNVFIGKHSAMAGQSGVAGSTKLGNHVVVGGQTAISGHLNITNKVQIGGGTNVIKDAKEEGSKIAGYYALDALENLKCYALYKRLPKLNQRIQELEKSLKD